jgi:hypothetical protein
MAKLTAAQRKKMPKKTFAVPSKKTKKNPTGNGGYPVPDANHARLALSMVSRYGTPAEKVAVKAKVHKKYPKIGKKKGK